MIEIGLWVMALTEFTVLDCSQKNRLLDIAQRAIENGMAGVEEDSLTYARKGGSIFIEEIPNFVSVCVGGQLRGCIGSLRPELPLHESVYNNAYSAAFSDHRFRPLGPDDLSGLVVEISILSPLQEIRVRDENDLLEQLVPRKDGLLIEYAQQRATFLPKVWESLPGKSQFLLELKRKAGMPDYWWSTGIRCFRYAAVSFSREIQGQGAG